MWCPKISWEIPYRGDMGRQHEDSSAISPLSTALPSPTSTFASSNIISDGPSFNTVEYDQSISPSAPCPRVSHSSLELLYSVEAKGSAQRQTSNSAKHSKTQDQIFIYLQGTNPTSVAKEDQISTHTSQAALQGVRDLSQHSSYQISKTL